MALQNVGLVGLGDIGLDMALRLVHLRNKFSVIAYDADEAARQSFVAAGGQLAKSATDAGKDRNVLICMVGSATEISSMLFNELDGGIVKALPQNAIILLCSTVQASYVLEIHTRLLSVGRTDLELADCPVLVSGEARGTINALVSGKSRTIGKVQSTLSCLFDNMVIIPGTIGSASNMKMIEQLVVGTSLVAAAEAMGLAASAGMNTREVFEIISNAAGSSTAFKSKVPAMIENQWNAAPALNTCVKDMAIVTSTARTHGVPVPLTTAAEQLYLLGASSGYGEDHDAGVVRLYLPKDPSAVQKATKAAAAAAAVSPDTGLLTPSVTPLEISKVAFVGLGAMGQGMAASLLRAGYVVHGYDVSRRSVQRFLDLDGRSIAAKSPYEAAHGANILIVMVQNAAQVNDVLFGTGKAVDALLHGAVVIITSTVPPSFVRSVEQRLQALEKGISLIDSPVSGGVARAAQGDLLLIFSGPAATIANTGAVLASMSGQSKNLCHIQGGVGAASSVKLINQLLAGVHIALAAEAVAFGTKLGLDTKTVFEVIKSSAGWSWMFENRVPSMLEADWTPHSALAIFVKDLGIVLDEAQRLGYAAPLSAAAHQLYLFGAARGWTNDSDSSIVRLWETFGNDVSISKTSV